MRDKIAKLFTRIILLVLITSSSLGLVSIQQNSTNINDFPDSDSNLSTQDVYWPGDSSEWTEVEAETQGLDSDKIAAMFRDMMLYIDIHSIIIVRNGYLIVEEYLYNYQVLDTKEYSDQLPPKSYSGPIYHDQASTTKSLISILIGIALQQGLLDNLNQTLYEFFGHIWNESTFVDSALKKNITIGQLLTMNSGLSGEYYHDPWPPVDSINLSLEHVPLSYTPGDPAVWEYTDFGPNLLSGIITNVTGGQSAGEFAKDNLFTPLGISEEEYNWNHDSLNISYGAYEFECSPKVQAKLGMLCLNNGTWNGTQIVDEDYIKDATSTQVSTGKGAYGYLWYTNGPYGGYYSVGAGGQNIYVIPQYNITVGFTGANEASYDPLLVNYIIQFAADNAPEWDRAPGSKTINEGDSFYYDVNASDTSGVDYSINDIVNFHITSEGIITNSRRLSAGVYPLLISAYNPFNNSITAGINVRVIATSSNEIPGFDFNLILFMILCTSAVLIFWRKKYSNIK
ncbi:MAG: serine hydrolase [Candidatus Lokiarchaeota archaeon]|nr:serine hydrolase [Candidatus Lokiarchaeota archaeon]